MGVRNLLAVALVIAAGLMPAARAQCNPSAAAAAAAKPVAGEYSVKYRGTLPCADCNGIDTVLTLTSASASEFSGGTYSLEMTYLGRSVAPLVSKGEWTAVHGMPGNTEATIYELNPDKPEQATYYLRVNEGEIRQLDRERLEIDSKLNFTLKRVSGGKQETGPSQ